MRRGRFITLEGGDGAGKSTQARHLAEWLRGHGRDVVLTREPGGAPGAETLRTLLLSGEEAWTPLAETLLHYAARAQHVACTIVPALEAGSWVVCDRFSDSTMAYQGYGQGADREAIATLTGLLGLLPDLTIVLDVPVAASVARVAGRGGVDRYERLGQAFLARVRVGFQAIAAAEPDRCLLLDARDGEADVAALIQAAVQERLGFAS